MGKPASPKSERDYVLGTHDEEIARLGVQHDVWRPRALGVWNRAGFNVEQTLIDVGCGPGYATLDLADRVGPRGTVVAVDRSRRFLDTLEYRLGLRGIEHVDVIESDLDVVDLGENVADGAWCRWVFAFVPRPKHLVETIARAIKPGGAFVAHEYIDYASWFVLPPSATFEEFVRATIVNWRNSGGEPDIGRELPRWLEDLGFEIEIAHPIVELITAKDYMWQWPKSFMETGLPRLVELGAVSRERAPAIQAELTRIAESDTIRMITPAVLELVARKR